MGEPLRLSFAAMGSACELQVFGPPAAVDAALAEVRRIEAKFSRYRPDSVVSRLNAAAGVAPYSVDEETAGLIAYGATCWEQSGGGFDLTSGVLRRVWDFCGGRVPSRQQVAELLPLIGWEKVRWDPPALLLPPGMEIDLGGVAKEYAADTAAAACLAAGAGGCLVNLGGDVRAAGTRPDGRPWHIGVRHPRRSDELVATVALPTGGMATSGDYERTIVKDGVRYCHILDPRTGWPVAAPPSVTVVAPVCLVAGSLATMAMLAGPDAPALLESSGLPWLLVAENGGLRGPLAVKESS